MAANSTALPIPTPTMPHSASAKKRHRQNLVRRQRNRATKSEIKSSIRHVLAAVGGGKHDDASEAFRNVARTVDRAAASNVIHANRAARIKSRLSARLLAAKKA